MRALDAVNFFHGKEKYNCAQAILKAFQDFFDIEDELIQKAYLLGSGRAEEGMCGALYAAKILISDCRDFEKVKRLFEDVAGSSKCLEIKAKKKLPCAGCVLLAAEFVDIIRCEKLYGSATHFKMSA